MKKLTPLLFLALLSACAEQPYVLSQTPDQVEICSGNQGIGSLIGAAQRTCSAYGRRAQYIQMTDKKECSRDNILVKGYVQQFRCLPER